MKKLFFFITGLLLWGLTVTVTAQENGTDKGIRFYKNESWEKILELARQQNKMIFMDCYTVWCGPCKALAKEVFPQEKVGDFFNPRFINVQYDMEKGDGKMLYEKYKKYIIGFPTLLLIDKDGNVLQQMAGYHEPDKLIEGIKKASEGKDLFTMSKKYQEGERSFDFIKDYIDVLNAAFLKDSVTVVAEDYLNRMDLKELDKDEVWNVLGEYIKDVNSPAFDYLVQNASRYYYRLHRDRYKIDRQLGYALDRELGKIVNFKFDENELPQPLFSDTVMEQKIVKYMTTLDLQGINEAKIKLRIHHLLLEENYPEAWRIIKEATEMGITGFYSFKLDDYIKYMMSKTDEKKLMKSFLQTLNNSMQGEKNKDFSFRTYKTLAELHQRLGNKKEAKEMLDLYQKKEQEAREKYKEFFQK